MFCDLSSSLVLHCIGSLSYDCFPLNVIRDFLSKLLIEKFVSCFGFLNSMLYSSTEKGEGLSISLSIFTKMVRMLMMHFEFIDNKGAESHSKGILFKIFLALLVFIC